MPILKVRSSSNSTLKEYLWSYPLALAIADYGFDHMWLGENESPEGLKFGECYLPESLCSKFKATKKEFKTARLKVVEQNIFIKTTRKTKTSIRVGKSWATPCIFKFVDNDWAYLMQYSEKTHELREAKPSLRDVPQALVNVARSGNAGFRKAFRDVPGTY